NSNLKIVCLNKHIICEIKLRFHILNYLQKLSMILTFSKLFVLLSEYCNCICNKLNLNNEKVLSQIIIINIIKNIFSEKCLKKIQSSALFLKYHFHQN